MKVLGSAIASVPVAYSPLRAIPGMPRVLRNYAREVLDPTHHPGRDIGKVRRDAFVMAGQE